MLTNESNEQKKKQQILNEKKKKSDPMATWKQIATLTVLTIVLAVMIYQGQKDTSPDKNANNQASRAINTGCGCGNSKPQL